MHMAESQYDHKIRLKEMIKPGIFSYVLDKKKKLREIDGTKKVSAH